MENSNEKIQTYEARINELQELKENLENSITENDTSTNDILGLYKTISNIQWDYDECSDQQIVGSLNYLLKRHL